MEEHVQQVSKAKDKEISKGSPCFVSQERQPLYSNCGAVSEIQSDQCDFNKTYSHSYSMKKCNKSRFEIQTQPYKTYFFDPEIYFANKKKALLVPNFNKILPRDFQKQTEKKEFLNYDKEIEQLQKQKRIESNPKVPSSNFFQLVQKLVEQMYVNDFQRYEPLNYDDIIQKAKKIFQNYKIKPGQGKLKFLY